MAGGILNQVGDDSVEVQRSAKDKHCLSSKLHPHSLARKGTAQALLARLAQHQRPRPPPGELIPGASPQDLPAHWPHKAIPKHMLRLRLAFKSPGQQVFISNKFKI